MTLRTLGIAALLVLLAVPASARQPEVAALGDVAVYGVDQPTRDDSDRCSAGRSDYYWAIGDWFTGNEVYAALAELEQCTECGGGWQATGVTVYLYWCSEGACDLTARGAIHAAVPCGDSYMPGETIVRSEPTVVGNEEKAGLWALTIDLPENTPVLADVFFVSVEFEDTCGNLPKIVTDSGPCVAGRSWNSWGTGWQSLCDFGFPGDLSLYATLQCQGPTAVERNTWTTIKATYR
jgi:hypothetical protein